MTIKLFLSIIGALGVVHGIAFIVGPYQVASVYGLEQSLAVALVSRLFGAALVAWGAILWQAKTFRDETAIRSVLISTCVAEAISLVFVVQATLAGTLNPMGWVAVVIYLFGAAGCAYFLTRTKRLAAI
jgi:drug/metabolite transporter (DMT)-like permease